MYIDWLGNSVFVQIARVLGGIFLVLQIILILDFVFLINAYLVERDGCKMTLILGSAVLFLASFGLSSLAYFYYVCDIHCTRNILFISWTIIIGVLVSLLSVSFFWAAGSSSLCAAPAFAIMLLSWRLQSISCGSIDGNCTSLCQNVSEKGRKSIPIQV